MATAMMEPMNRSFWRAVSAECLAMFLFVFIGIGCALSATGVVDGAAPDAKYNATLSISLCFGLNIFVLAHCFGHISGAHINPAVTLALVISRQVTPLRGAFYALAHCFGSVAASACVMVVMGLTPDTMGGCNALSGPSDNRIARGLLLEIILTFLLCFTVLATIDPAREATNVAPLAIGMAVGVAHLMAVPVTGCGINPARSIGPAFFADHCAREDLWVFLVGPFVGAALAALLYPLWFAEEDFSGGLLGRFHTKETGDIFVNVSKVTMSGSECGTVATVGVIDVVPCKVAMSGFECGSVATVGRHLDC